MSIVADASNIVMVTDPFYHEKKLIENAKMDIKNSKKKNESVRQTFHTEADKFRTLTSWTLTCLLIHTLWTIVSIGLYTTVNSFRNYGVDITYVKSSRFAYETGVAFNFNITLASGIFSFLSAVFHVINMSNEYGYQSAVTDRYEPVNIYRWIEYSLSASLMAVIVAVICRVNDLTYLMLVFTFNALTMTMGIPLEILRKSKYYNLILWMTWIFFGIGSSTLFLILWFYTDTIPVIAWASLFTISILFQSFGFWQLTVRMINEEFSVYDYELGYCLLSVIAKSALWGFVIWGGSTDSVWLRELRKCNFESLYNII